MRLETVSIDRVIEPAVPMRAEIDMHYIEELANSIRVIGLRQPMQVKMIGDKFEVIAGHCRLLACHMAELEKVPVLVRDDGDDANDLAAKMHENLIRRDVSPIEEAICYAEAFEACGDLEKIAAMTHRSVALIERRLALLAGDAEVRDALQRGEISVGVAEQLNKVRDETTRHFLLKFAVQEGATVEKVMGWRKQYHSNPVQAGAEPEAPADPAPTPEIPEYANTCYLCGSQEYPHELRVRMVHESCDRLMRRNAAEAAQHAGAAGND